MKKFYMVIFSLCALACEPESVTPKELSDYVANEENGLLKASRVGDTKVEVVYRPTDLLVQEENSDPFLDSASLNTLTEKYGRYHYFIVSFSHNKKESLHQVTGTQYTELVQTLSFRMPNYVTLTTEKGDSILVSDFVLNRTYGLSASTDLVFAFKRNETVGSEWIQFNLNEFGLGIGNQRFRFRTKDLMSIPKLKIRSDASN